MRGIPCSRKAQNIIEYIVLFVAVVVVMLVFLKRGGNYENAVNKVIQQPLKMVDEAVKSDF